MRRIWNTLQFQILKMRGLTDLPVLPSRRAAAPDERELYPHLFPNYKPDPTPEITVGSILLWAILKLALAIALIWFVFERFGLYEYWLVGLGLIWLTVVYPAFMQYQRFKKQTEILQENTLCAKCRHFDETGHFCKLLDEHVSVNYTPCGGESWEARQTFGNDDDDNIAH